MTFRVWVQQHFPGVVQDALRTAVDMTSPRRRRSTATTAREQGLLERVSPSREVLAGPFAGLRLEHDASWGGAAARLAGTYEHELADILEARIAANPALVVDIGAAEGYYAVGMAKRLPAARIISFEIDRQARALIRKHARLNNVTNLRVRGRALPSALRRALRGGSDALILCDCEGYESELIDPGTVPELIDCFMIIELHEFAVPGVTADIVARFSHTHEIALVDAVSREADRPPQLSHLTYAQLRRATDEGRPQDPRMQWAVMRPICTR